MAQPEPKEAAEPGKDDKPRQSRLHKFVTTYSTFLSSFVIGAAGLIATTIYQTKQQDIARRQAEAQIEISKVNTENQWKIERAEILSKNLQVLTSNGNANVDQRYGVLLSLTRAEIIDAELAVSYAIELGAHNPDYMRSVLLNVGRKSYLQLAHNYVLTCAQRFGVTRMAPPCKSDRFAARSAAIAELIAEELDGGNRGALALLEDEPKVQDAVRRLSELFAPYLEDLAEKRQLAAIERFEGASAGARLVAAVVLSADRAGDLVSAEEAAARRTFHEARRRWLEEYLLGRACDPECKGRLADLMLTDGPATGGAFDGALAALVARPEAERSNAVGRLHGRLLWCQVDAAAAARLRDRVLVPAALAAAKERSPEAAERLDDLIGLLALVPEPSAEPGKAAFSDLADAVRRAPGERWQKGYLSRRSAADRQRRSPPPSLRARSLCNAAEGHDAVAASGDEE